MQDTKQRAIAESVFNRNQRREPEINGALAQEVARHEAAVKNMHRLRALRLGQESNRSKVAASATRAKRNRRAP